MKNQVSPPDFTSARAVPLARVHVSKVHCTVVGAHWEPVRSEVAVLEARNARSFSRSNPLMASATAEFGTSVTAATPS
jgi:hypothetical protein